MKESSAKPNPRHHISCNVWSGQNQSMTIYLQNEATTNQACACIHQAKV